MSNIVTDLDWSAGTERRGGGGFEATLLPDPVKEELARSLLAEFGVTSITTREPDGELIHCCPLPWHPETKPSASLNYKKLTFRCLGCNSKGGLLWFIATVRGISGPDARTWLGEQTGLEGADFDLKALLDLLDALYDDSRKTGPPPMPSFGEKVLAPWRFIHPILTTGVPELGIKGRGIPEANLISMQVGFASDMRVRVGESFVSSQRIVIPHYWRDNLVGWQSRRVGNDGTPKYLSTADFPKDRTLYNFDGKRRRAVVVESPMSVLRHLHHLPMEATFGASVTDGQMRLLTQHEQVILWMDNDTAGWNAVEGHFPTKQVNGKLVPGPVSPGLGARLSPYCDVRVVDSPWAADAAEMDEEMAADLVEQAIPYALWNRPTVLYCLACRQSHEGVCSPNPQGAHQ